MVKSFLLCFHDLNVQNYNDVLPILFKLKKIAGPFSVLVIPDTTGSVESQILGFKNVLRELKEEGFELALHGFRHSVDFNLARNLYGSVANRIANNEAEFAGLCELDSARLLEAAINAWNCLMDDEAPVAFIAPTWHGNTFLAKQVNERGMLFEGRSVLKVSSQKQYCSPVASFAGIPEWSEKLALLAGNCFLKMPFGVPRIALHPVDFPKLEKPISCLIESAISCRKLVKYQDLL